MATAPQPAGQAAQTDGLALCRIPELLAHGAPHCPDGLIGAEAWSRVASLPSALPAASSFGAFECRLEAGATRVDFEACIRAAGGGRAALSAGLAKLERAVSPRDVGWQRTLGFLREWTDPTSVVFHGIPVVWLEFDLETQNGPHPAPFVVVTLSRERTAEGRPLPHVMEALSRLQLLRGGAVDPAVACTVARSLEQLPPGGRLLHVALRPAGDGDIFRIVVKLAWEELSAYLVRIGWPGSSADLSAWLDATCRATPTPSINLDLGASVGPRLGIEYYFDGSPTVDPRWRTVFDALESAGACTPERRTQLEAWPSAADVSPCTRLLRVDRALLIKAVYETDAPLRAKAYLPFSVRLNLG